MAPPDPALLDLEGICKTYGTLRANDGIDLRIEAGEIHALLGENGAGKSTLVKIINGVQDADSGTVRWKGEEVRVRSPSQAREMGIGVVFQHFSLFRALTVAENIALGMPGVSPGEIAGRVSEISSEYGFAVDPHRPLHSLSVGEWQRVEIIRCLLGEPSLIVLDEPTSVLTPQEAELLFSTLRRLVDGGCAVLYISHRLSEIRDLCHNATVMRGGKVVANCDPAEETPASLAQMMIGHRPTPPVRASAAGDGAKECLRIDGLSLPSESPFGVALQDVSLEVEQGAILGIAGIAGNGQQELGEALSGERSVGSGRLFMDGRDIGALHPGARRRLGLHFVPEERYGHGAVSGMALWENACMTARESQDMVRSGMIIPERARRFSDGVIDAFQVVCENADSNAASLSGGNLQKFIVGREVAQRPRLLVIMQPTWGIDAGAEALIHQSLLDLAAAGTAVLAISQDLDEILALSDRIAVISDGRLSEAVPASETSAEQLGLLMGAVHGVTESANQA